MAERPINTKVARYLTELLRDDGELLGELDRPGDLRSWVRDHVREVAEDEDLLRIVIRESGLDVKAVLEAMPVADLLEEAQELADTELEEQPETEDQ
jgi:hypothetical protein